MRSFIFGVLYAVLLLGTFCSAWPWRPYGEILANSDTLDKRAKTTASNTATPTASETTDTAAGTPTGQTTTGTRTDSETKTKTTTTTSISIDPAAGAGGISMITPAATTTTYYKVGQDVTFVWNYTSLTVTPSAIDVVASCSLNSATYTLTQNMSVAPTGTLIWDTGKYQSTATIGLLTATYTLYVYDASKSLGDIPQPGYLGSLIGFPFGMYTPEKYTPLNQFKCVTCNGALSDIQAQGLKFAIGMAAITVVSFTWFIGGLGVFST